MGFLKDGYVLIDINLGCEHLIAKTFETIVKVCKVPRGTRQLGISPAPIEFANEILSVVVHRDYLTPIVEK